MSERPSSTALFRYRVVSATEALCAVGYSLSEAVRLVADQEHLTPKGLLKRFTPRTIYRWRRAYATQGLEGLEPRGRAPLLGSRVVEKAVLDYLVEEHAADPYASIPELLRRARVMGVVRENQRIDRRAVWRAFRRLGLDTVRRARPRTQLVRRFEYAERMQMVMVDGCHFRAGPRRVKRVVLYFLDDATRFGLAAIVGTSERTESFLQGLLATVRRFGLMDALYSDNGAAFVSEDASRVLANLGVAHITGTPGYPQARGKIERFNRSVRARVLNGLAAEGVDPSPRALTLRLTHDLRDVYNRLPHSSLANQSPQQRWEASRRPLVPARSEAWLGGCFVLTESRRVRSDNVISFGGKLFDVPPGYAGEEITLHRRLMEDNRLYIRHRGRWLRLAEVDLHGNATQRRSPYHHNLSSLAAPSCKNAAMMAFEQSFGPIVTDDGGFPASTPDQEETSW